MRAMAILIFAALAVQCIPAIAASETATYWSDKGNASLKNGSFEEAVTYYDSALQIDSNQSSIWYAKGNALFYLARFNDSLEAYDRAV